MAKPARRTGLWFDSDGLARDRHAVDREPGGEDGYTPSNFTGYWLIENLLNGMSMMEWFGLRYRHFAKHDATLCEAICVMQEATFDQWRRVTPRGLELLDARRGEWR